MIDDRDDIGNADIDHDVRDDDRVGYGSPPKASQFQPGRSGNPSGRPKKVKAVSQLMHEAMQDKVTVIENGKKVTMTKAELATKNAANSACKDVKYLKIVADIQAPHYAKQEAEARSSEASNELDEDIIAAFLARQND